MTGSDHPPERRRSSRMVSASRVIHMIGCRKPSRTTSAGIHQQAGPQPPLQPAGLAAHDGAHRHPEQAGTLQVQPPSQDAVGIGPVQGDQLIQGEHGVLGEIGDMGVHERAVRRVPAGVVGGLAPVREHHRRGDVRLVDGRHDIAVGDQLLDLEGVLLAIGEPDSFQEDQHRVAGLVVGHRRGLDGVGGDVVQVLGGELRQRRQRRRKRVGVPHIGSTRRRWVGRGPIPELHHQFATVIWIGGEGLRTVGVHPVVGQRADPVAPGRMREAEHGAHGSQGSVILS